MARFIFQLESVLKQRQAEEREQQVAVAGLERERAEFEDLIRSYQRDLTQEREELRQQLSSQPGQAARLDLRGVRFQAGASLRLVTLAQRAVLQMAGVHKRLEGARAALLEATTRRKAVETLRERRHAEWLQEQKRAEEAAADELTIMRAGRQAEAL